MGIRVLIIDDDAGTRAVYRSAFEFEPDIDLVGEASAADAGIELAGRLRPDVIMIDQQMPALAGVDALASLRQSLPGVAIILATAGEVDRIATGAVAAGADVVMQKSGRLAELTGEIRRLAEQHA